jgi:hypothetical protein
LGGRDTAGFLAAGQWQVEIAYRSLTADVWYVGTAVHEDKAPFGQPLYLDIDSVDLTASYGVSERLSVSLTLPWSHGEHSRYYGDGRRHEVEAEGLGDVTLVADRWLLDPRGHPDANLSLGVGVKAPTGKEDVEDNWFVPGGSFRFAVDQSIQLGDGGWGVVLRGQGYRPAFGATSWYGSGSYLVSPKNTTRVTFGPGGPPISVPDTYYARLGLTFPLAERRGLSASLGGRVDGLLRHDLVGKSDGFRRPVFLAYVDPVLSLTRGSGTFSLNVPVRVYADFRRSRLDEQLGTSGGGDLADYLFFVSYRHRF